MWKFHILRSLVCPIPFWGVSEFLPEIPYCRLPLEFLIANLIPQEFIFVIDVIALRHKFPRKFMM